MGNSQKSIASNSNNPNIWEQQNVVAVKSRGKEVGKKEFKVSIISKRLSRLKGLEQGQKITVTAPIECVPTEKAKLQWAKRSQANTEHPSSPQGMVISQLSSESNSPKQSPMPLKKSISVKDRNSRRFKPSQLR